MNKKKIYILEREERAGLIEGMIRKHGVVENIEIKVEHEYNGIIPKEYDTYLIHLGLTDREAVIKMRKELPEKIVRITFLAGRFFVPSKLRDIYYTYDDEGAIKLVLSELGVLRNAQEGRIS